ncbi:MAG TPA: POTRA domain-containing protein [Ignavibacteriaceae bacterium]|nr:POTRA domain-containing protein [Ignavibacteriaceae bacterium]
MILQVNRILLCSILFVTTNFSQVVQSFKITGNINFSENQYYEWTGIRNGLQIFPGIMDSIKKRSANELSARGYFDFKFSGDTILYSVDSQKVFLSINISEGSPSYINEIIIDGKDSIEKRFTDLFEYQEGQIFNKQELEENISETLTYLEDSGYPFAKVIVTSVQLKKIENENFATVNLNIDKGSKSTIDKIEITGNTSTKDYVITRELRIDSSTVYSQKQISEFPARLNRLRFFEPVNVPQFYFNSENKGVLLIDVKEKQTNNFDGIIGFIPPASEDEKGYLTGLVNISLRNLFGTGRAAAIRWQQFDRNSQELELKYLEPWIFSYPFNINLGLFQRKQDTTYVQRKFEGALEFLATEEISASLLLGTEQIIPTETQSDIFRVFNSSILTTGVNLKIDTRDDPYSPTSGLFFLNSYSFSRKTINGPVQFITPGLKIKINLQRFAGDFFYFLEIFSRQVIAAGLHGRELRGSFFENSDLFRLGGTNSLRGYREDQFLGARIFWTNLEYRLLLSRRTFAFLFFDTGYYLREADIERNILKTEDFLYGYGLGLNLETGLGVLGVSFALGEGDNFSDGKIHFGIVNEF